MALALKDLTAAQLLAVYNHHTSNTVARFASADIAKKRLIKLLGTIEVSMPDAIAATFPETSAQVEPVAPVAPAKASRWGAPASANLNSPEARDQALDAPKVTYVPAAPAVIHHAQTDRGLVRVTPQVAPIAGMTPLGKAPKGKAAPAPAPVKAPAAKAAPVKAAPVKDTGKLTVKTRIMEMMKAPGGVSEKEVCAALGWVKAGATIGRTIKAAPFKVAKVKGADGKTRYAAV